MSRNEPINGNTPEAVKTGLGICASDKACEMYKCPYQENECRKRMANDALLLILRLEEKVARRDALLAEMGIRIPEGDSNERK